MSSQHDLQCITYCTWCCVAFRLFGLGLHFDLQGPYVVTISVTSGPPGAAGTPDQLLCLEVDFDIAPPGARDVIDDITAGIKSKLHTGRRALV